MPRRSVCLASLLCALALAPPAAASSAGSVCYGSTAKGRLEGGCKLPYVGENYVAYSRLGSLLGRTYLHCRVAQVVVAAYRSLHRRHPDKRFVYGETGWASGGRIKPHRTHQNGLSVDFMVPVIDAAGRSVRLPTHPFNLYGYGVEFDGRGRAGDLAIDYEAVAAHLLAIAEAAAEAGVGIRRVIFAPDLQPALRSAARWPALADRIALSQRPAWVRHDDHYHVDFAIPCEPMG